MSVPPLTNVPPLELVDTGDTQRAAALLHERACAGLDRRAHERVAVPGDGQRSIRAAHARSDDRQDAGSVVGPALIRADDEIGRDRRVRGAALHRDAGRAAEGQQVAGGDADGVAACRAAAAAKVRLLIAKSAPSADVPSAVAKTTSVGGPGVP